LTIQKDLFHQSIQKDISPVWLTIKVYLVSLPLKMVYFTG